MSKNKTLCIAEWQTFGKEDIKAIIADESDEKAQKIFNELKAFADDKGNHIFLNSYGKNRLKARNYVGLIQTKSGFCLEILPKTFRTAQDKSFDEKRCVCGQSEQNPCEVCKAKNLVFDMLKTSKKLPITNRLSTIQKRNTSLLEVFAMMFLNELESLIKKGIKSDYVVREENRAFLKGKLLFTPNLKHNFAHKERFFTASDEFISDIAPNRLIVSTLLFLSHQNFSVKTNARIMQSRFVFDEISPSKNYDKDFAKCVNLRHFKSYELVLLWCKVFLKRHNFIPYQGSEKAFALLFDMNELFESFVAWHLKKTLTNHIVKAQDTGKHLLLENGENKFRIRPDIVGYKDNKANFIADTKWKILNFSRNDYGISQGDLYQVFAYLAKYQCQNGILIYPKIDDEKEKVFTYKAESNLQSKDKHALKFYFFDVNDAVVSAKKFADMC